MNRVELQIGSLRAFDRPWRDREAVMPDGSFAYRVSQRVLNAHKERSMNADRVPVYTTLDALDSLTWVLALSAMRGVIQTSGEVVMDDPTRQADAVAAIDAEIARLKATQGR